MATKETTAALEAKFAAALGCTTKFIQTRLRALGHGSTCGRCGGCGRHSYCQMHGTICFGCNGSGKAATKLTAKLLATVTEQVAAGGLDAYLAEVKARSERKEKVKGAKDRFFAAWESNPIVAKEKGLHYSKLSHRHYDVNAFCSGMSQELFALVLVVEEGEWSKEQRRNIPASASTQDAAVARILEIIDLASRAEEIAPVTAR